MPTEFADDKFKEILDTNKMQYNKAEHMKSKRNGRLLQIFQLELKNPAESKALISENLMCPQSGIIFKVEDVQAPMLVGSVITAKISTNIVGPKVNVSSVEKATYIKDAQIKKKVTKVYLNPLSIN